ncbi:hypothetical protein, partial [Acinetobacter nosocomialis]|uniref:hypothetical protein n=1 Tax=Acinetobacter nosocomialis TaxID=106654 RepID=UPI0013D8BF39
GHHRLLRLFEIHHRHDVFRIEATAQGKRASHNGSWVGDPRWRHHQPRFDPVPGATAIRRVLPWNTVRSGCV